MESASPETVAAARAHLHNPQFELIVVPKALPATKPKALNFALPMARGELVVVYDAEDIPAPLQLRKAAAHFAERPELVCLQAELRTDNGEQSWLTALFAGEYAGLFGVILPFVAERGLPLPLGGSSNHFRTRILAEIGGWDAFNVTEDADLGVRLARRGLACATLGSATLEEAPISGKSWMQQRTRWMKGWMQTFLVHNRDPASLLADLGWRNFLFFEVYVGGLIVSPLLHTVFLSAMGLRWALGEAPLAGPFGGILGQIALAIMGIGYASAGLVSIAGLLRRSAPQFLLTQALLPLYWVMMGFATLRAANELLRRPHFWAKTRHGQRARRRSRIVWPLGHRKMGDPDPTRRARGGVWLLSGKAGLPPHHDPL